MCIGSPRPAHDGRPISRRAPSCRRAHRIGPAPRSGSASARVEATLAAVGQNTNLGIVLLAAPLATAALSHGAAICTADCVKVLDGSHRRGCEGGLSRRSAHANPGGLGDARRMASTRSRPSPCSRPCGLPKLATASPGTIPMTMPIFSVSGLRCCREARRAGGRASFAATRVYLGFLSTIPDTLIERKFGAPQARKYTRKPSLGGSR